MPELPEVEYTARQLQAAITGARIQEIHIFWEPTIARPLSAEVQAILPGLQIQKVRRRGKFVLLDLSEDWFLSIHRRMTGNFLLLPAGWKLDTSLREADPLAWKTRGPLFQLAVEETSLQRETQYCRVCFVLQDGRCLLFTDPRKFGRISLWPRALEGQAFAHLGPEPLDGSLTVEYFASALARRRVPIKQALLDQAIVVGVGNIYADEALFYASLHPRRRADSLTLDEVRLLHKGVITVLTHGIEHGGTSFSTYRDLWGEAGENYNHVAVYQQDGKPCTRCGTLIERIVVAQRSSHFCPGCQKLSQDDAKMVAETRVSPL